MTSNPWTEITPSKHHGERQEFSYLRNGLPDDEPLRARSNQAPYYSADEMGRIRFHRAA